MEAEKAHLSEELKDFSSTRQEAEALRKERDGLKVGADSLKKEKEEIEAEATNLHKNVSEVERARDLAVQRAEKADDITERLRKELDAEHVSVAAMQTRLQEAEAVAVIGLYSGSLAQFGGSTSAPPSGGDVGVSLAWLKSHISMLPHFVGGAIDFRALAVVNSFARLLHRGGCSHAEAVAKEEFSSAADVGEATSSLLKSVRNFISSFWIRFGWVEAKNMAEARRAEVRLFFVVLWTLYGFCFCVS